ncbi:hypothetical protein [Oxalobacter paraformigenes]|uniref:Uncharacterized protein n=1 Tax=Oxalobacter paraformigenes TaxID=556268 RepID=C3X2A5_9BURK|nr:hypothetical protein [Oxalobacter paraformigenes]EEO27341.1 hypothetical protein OFAG_00494 [Oxalobacter paraformigenes]
MKVLEKLGNVGYKYVLDYFAFFGNTAFDLPKIFLNENFSHEYINNKLQFDYIYSILGDDLSKLIFSKLIYFKNTYDIGYLVGFENNESGQYFDFPLAIEGIPPLWMWVDTMA